MTAPTTRADHAELARWVDDYEQEAALDAESDGDLSHVDDGLREFPLASVKSLLSEIAALRGEVERVEADRIRTVDDRMAWTRRAREAERQRDDAVGLLRDFIEPYAALDDVQLFRTVTTGHATRITSARAFLANQGADQ